MSEGIAPLEDSGLQKTQATKNREERELAPRTQKVAESGVNRHRGAGVFGIIRVSRAALNRGRQLIH